MAHGEVSIEGGSSRLTSQIRKTSYDFCWMVSF